MAGARVPAVLRKRLGQEATLGLVGLLDAEQAKWSDRVLNVAGDRFERHVTEQVSGLRVDFHQRLTDQVSVLRVDLASLRVELIKWSFLFWVGQLAAMAGLLAYMLRASGR